MKKRRIDKRIAWAIVLVYVIGFMVAAAGAESGVLHLYEDGHVSDVPPAEWNASQQQSAPVTDGGSTPPVAQQDPWVETPGSGASGNEANGDSYSYYNEGMSDTQIHATDVGWVNGFWLEAAVAGEAYTLVVPVSVLIDGYTNDTNVNHEGVFVPYSPYTESAYYSQQTKGTIAWMNVILDTPVGDGNSPFTADGWYYDQATVIDGNYNLGYAVFDGLRIREDFVPGSYMVNFVVRWRSMTDTEDRVARLWAELTVLPADAGGNQVAFPQEAEDYNPGSIVSDVQQDNASDYYSLIRTPSVTDYGADVAGVFGDGADMNAAGSKDGAPDVAAQGGDTVVLQDPDEVLDLYDRLVVGTEDEVGSVGSGTADTVGDQTEAIIREIMEKDRVPEAAVWDDAQVSSTDVQNTEQAPAEVDANVADDSPDETVEMNALVAEQPPDIGAIDQSGQADMLSTVSDVELASVELDAVTAGEQVSLSIAARLALTDVDAVDTTTADDLVMLSVTLDTEQFADESFPFEMAENTVAEEQTIVLDGVNYGDALVDGLQVREDVQAGTYPVRFNVVWQTAEAETPQEATLTSDVVIARVVEACACCEHCVICYDDSGVRRSGVCGCLDEDGVYTYCHCDCPYLIDPDDPQSGMTDCGCDCHGVTLEPFDIPLAAPSAGSGAWGAGAVVYTYHELREAVAAPLTSEESAAGGKRVIYLGYDPDYTPESGDNTYPAGNATAETIFDANHNDAGADAMVVPAYLSELVICGTDPNNGTRMTVTDYRGIGEDSAFLRHPAGDTGARQVTLADMNAIGNNYWGLVYSSYATGESLTTDKTTVFSNVTYTGRQIYHAEGAGCEGVFINCDVTITQTDGGWGAEEFAEANNLTFRGTNTISKPDSAGVGYALMSLGRQSEGAVTVEQGAVLMINTATSLFDSEYSAEATTTLNVYGTLNLTFTDGGSRGRAGGMIEGSTARIKALNIGSAGSVVINADAGATIDAYRLVSVGELNVDGNLEVYYRPGAAGAANPVYVYTAMNVAGSMRVDHLVGGGHASTGDTLVAQTANVSGELTINQDRGARAVYAMTSLTSTGTITVNKRAGSTSATVMESPVITLTNGSIVQEIGATTVKAGVGNNDGVDIDGTFTITKSGGVENVINARTFWVSGGNVTITQTAGGAAVVTPLIGGSSGTRDTIVCVEDGGTLTIDKGSNSTGSAIYSRTLLVGGGITSGNTCTVTQRAPASAVYTKENAQVVGSSLTIDMLGSSGHAVESAIFAVLNDGSTYPYLRINVRNGDSAVNAGRHIAILAGADVEIRKTGGSSEPLVQLGAGADGDVMILITQPEHCILSNDMGALFGGGDGRESRITANSINLETAGASHVWNNGDQSAYTVSFTMRNGLLTGVTSSLENEGAGAVPHGEAQTMQTFSVTSATTSFMQIGTFGGMYITPAPQRGDVSLGYVMGSAASVQAAEYATLADDALEMSYRQRTQWQASGSMFVLQEPLAERSEIFLLGKKADGLMAYTNMVMPEQASATSAGDDLAYAQMEADSQNNLIVPRQNVDADTPTDEGQEAIGEGDKVSKGETLPWKPHINRRYGRAVA